MSQDHNFPLSWIVSLALHGVLFLILAYWVLPRVVAMKGSGEDTLVVELNIVEPIEEPQPEPVPNSPLEEVITTHHQEAAPIPIIEPIKEPPPPPKPQIKRPSQEKKVLTPKPNPPQTIERGMITEANVSEILKQVKPHYPQAAIRAGHQGTVSLILDIGEDGRVVEVNIKKSSGREDCDRAAVEALQRWWRFRATGKPYQRSIDIHFRLQ